MGHDHYANIINQQLELAVYSEGGITWDSSENMSADELAYVIYNFKKVYEDKQKSRQEFIKSVFEYANKGLESLFKLLGKLGGGKGN
jgi:hypothetical protein